jgi:hypothetical protein
MNRPIVILSTRQNDVWHSMQEIIPGLEDQWSAYARERAIPLEIINVDDVSRFKDKLPLLLRCQLIVVTAFNLKIVEAITLLRQKMGVDAPLVFYLHNQATIALWPLHFWKIFELLRTSDFFISTSSRDKETFDAVFDDAKSLLVPFSMRGEGEQACPKGKQSKKFIYVGRLSSQKNLHLLLVAFSLALKVDPALELELFGGEDRLGSPNMGVKDSGYLARIQELARSLAIADRVVFHGHRPRREIHTYLASTPHIFVSPSLHSDENFGMAALHSLTLGAPAVLSDWGGHADFKMQFADQVQAIDVYESSAGPFLCPVELAQGLLEASKKSTHGFVDPVYYHSSSAYKTFDQILASENIQYTHPLKVPEVLSKMLTKRAQFAHPDQMKIFEDYNDPDAHFFFHLYGARKRREWDESLEIDLLPWVVKTREGYEIDDPHRGKMRLKSTKELYLTGFAFKRS